MSRFSVNPKSTEGEREDEEDSLYATGLLNFFFRTFVCGGKCSKGRDDSADKLFSLRHIFSPVSID